MTNSDLERLLEIEDILEYSANGLSSSEEQQLQDEKKSLISKLESQLESGKEATRLQVKMNDRDREIKQQQELITLFEISTKKDIAVINELKDKIDTDYKIILSQHQKLEKIDKWQKSESMFDGTPRWDELHKILKEKSS